MSLDLVKAIPFKNFCYMKNKSRDSNTIWINGIFKEEGSEEIINGDIFKAVKLLGCSLEEIYRIYIDWFNVTLRQGEKKRIFVSVKEHKEVDRK